MAAQDLQVQHWQRSNQRQASLASDMVLEDEATQSKDSKSFPLLVLKSLLKRRWWAVAIAFVIAAGGAFLLSDHFKTETYRFNSTLIHVGVPSLPGASANREVSPATCAELVSSPEVLESLYMHGDPTMIDIQMDLTGTSRRDESKYDEADEAVDDSSQLADDSEEDSAASSDSDSSESESTEEDEFETFQYQMAIQDLRKLITAKSRRHTELVDITLEWPKQDSGITVLSAINVALIDEMNRQRASHLAAQENLIEDSLETVNEQISDARAALAGLELAPSESGRDQFGNFVSYEEQLAKLEAIEEKIIELNARKSSVLDQVDVLKLQTGNFNASREIAELKAQRFGVESLDPILEETLETYADGSKPFQQLSELRNELSSELKAIEEKIDALETALVTSEEGLTESSSIAPQEQVAFKPSVATEVVGEATENADSDVAAPVNRVATTDLESFKKRWAKRFAKVDELLSEADRDTIDSSLDDLDQKVDESLRDVLASEQRIRAQVDSLQLSIIPIDSELELQAKAKVQLEEVIADYGRDNINASEVTAEIAVPELERLVGQKNLLENQLANTRHLESSEFASWQIQTHPSLENATVESDRKKLAITFFGLGFLLCTTPLLLLEVQHCRELPHVRMVKSLGLPVLAHRVLKDFLPHKRQRWEMDFETTPSQLEALRMLTLRVQQSSHRKGSVILFTGMDSDTSSVVLTAAVAHCLAEREEQVLVIDAVSPTDATKARGNKRSITQPRTLKQINMEGSDAKKNELTESGTGLSEILAGVTTDPVSAIRSSGVPNVDILESGSIPFPREAMAKSSLTQLLQDLRKRYSMILINGPSADHAADIQMLTARADGVVLAAGSRTHQDSAAYECIRDLIDLNAPIIGVVA